MRKFIRWLYEYFGEVLAMVFLVAATMAILLIFTRALMFLIESITKGF